MSRASMLYWVETENAVNTMTHIKRLLNASLISTLDKQPWKTHLAIYQRKELDLFTELLLGDTQPQQPEDEEKASPTLIFAWRDETGERFTNAAGESVSLSPLHARRQQIAMEGWQLEATIRWAVVRRDPPAIILDDGDDEQVAAVFHSLAAKTQPSVGLERALLRWLGY